VKESSSSLSDTPQLDAWIIQISKNLSSSDLAQLYVHCLNVLWQRSQMTIGSVTLCVIFDRVLHDCREKFPLLLHINIQPNGVVLDDYLRTHEAPLSEVTQAFRFLFIELINILGKFTADILTKALYLELFKITGNPMRTKANGSKLKTAG
jgi:hypothetical protein